MRWSDVHLDTGRLEITQALTAIGYETSFSRLKTKTSRRCITLHPDTVTHLKTWRKQQAEALAQAGLNNELGLVFTGSNGGPLHPHLASQAFARAQKGLAVTPIRFHDIRHTHATLLLRDRVPIKVVSEQSVVRFTVRCSRETVNQSAEAANRSPSDWLALVRRAARAHLASPHAVAQERRLPDRVCEHSK